MCVCPPWGALVSLGSLHQALLLEKVPAVGVVGNWGFSLQAWLCVMAVIPRGEQGSSRASGWPCLFCCREWSGRQRCWCRAMMPFGGMAARVERDRLRAEGLGQHHNAIKYLNQDYEALKQQCIESGTLFRDPQFPAGPTALGFKELGPHSSKTRGVEWKRPSVSAELASSQAGLRPCPACLH